MIRLTGLVNFHPLKEEGIKPKEIPARTNKDKRARLAETLRGLKKEQTLSEEQLAKIDELLEKLDPVGKEDNDVNNDKKVDDTDLYLMNRRKAIGNAMSLKEDVNAPMDNMQDEPYDDHEGRMAKADLLSIHKKTGELYNMIGEDEELEGWVQAKITKAADYINSVHNSMQYEKSKPASIGNGEMSPAEEPMNEEAEQVEELDKSTLASYVKKAATDLKNKSKAKGEDDFKHYPTKWSKDNDTKIRSREQGIAAAADRLARSKTNEEIEEGKWDYPKDMTTTKTTSHTGSTNAADNRERRKDFRKKVKAAAHKKLMSGAKEEPEQLNEVAPKGWEATIKKMKKHREISNPWALVYWMKSKGYQPRKKKKD